MAHGGSKGANESDITSPDVGQKLCFDEETLQAKAEVYFNKGNEAYRKKDYSNAVYFYTDGIEVNCKDEDLKVKLYINRALAHHRLGNYSDSLRDAKVVKDIRPLFIKAIITGAKASAKLGLFEQAMTWSDEGLAIDKENQDLLEIKSLSVVKREKLLTQEGDKEAKQEGDSRTNPKPLDCTSIIADTRKNDGNDAFLNHDFVKAINLYTEGIEVKCEDEDLNAKLYNNRASAHYHLENYHDCLSDLKAATALQPSYLKAIIRGANTCLKLKRIEEAIHWCDKGLAIDKENTTLLKLRKLAADKAKCISGNGDSDDKSFRKHGLYDKTSSYNLGIAALRRCDFTSARNYFELELNEAKQAGDKNRKCDAYTGLGKAYHSLGDYRKAIELLQQSLSIIKEIGDKDSEAEQYDGPPNLI